MSAKLQVTILDLDSSSYFARNSGKVYLHTYTVHKRFSHIIIVIAIVACGDTLHVLL